MIKFDISSQIVEIAPNSVSQVTLTVTNTSQIIDFFTVTIEPLISPETMGLYPGWVDFNQPTFSLRPAGDAGRGGDSSQTVIAKINIPPQVYAGNYAGNIIITARSGADNSAEIPFNIVISQIDLQTLEIQPIESASRKSTEVYRVVVSNQGNAPHIYSVYAEDPNDDLKFTIDPPEVPLRPGEQAAITLKAQPRTRNWVGDEVNHEFKVKMEGSDQEIRGSFKQKAAIAPLHWFGRHWGRFVFFLALLLVLLIVGAIFLLPLIIRPSTSAYCAPVSLRNVNVLSNGTTTNILVSGRNGAQPYAVAVTEQADKLPGIFGSLVSVSPDGRRIAYVTASDLAMNDARIWIKNLDTDQAAIASIPITTGLWPVAPVWSANGEKLAYVVRRPTPVAASTTATVTTAATTPAVGVTGTATTAPPATTAAAATTAGTPGAAAADASQLDLYVVTKIGEDPKLLASPQGLKPDLFYGNNISSDPLCWASDDASLLVRPQTTDNSQVQVALADGKTQVITPQAGGLTLPKPSLPSLPGLVMPLNSLVGVPASFLQVPQSHFSSVQQQTGTGTPGTTATQRAGTGTTPATGGTTPATSTANTCSIAHPFSQNDPRWADLPLKDGSTNTLAELGCPITGAAILLNYQNVDTNPAELSSCLGNLTSPLNQAGWFAIAQQCGGFKLQGGVRADFSWDLLDSALQKGPTIVGLLGGPSGSHFLVVTGGYNAISTSYTVTDPWDGTTYKTLDYFLSKGYRPRWVISYEGNSAACVTSIPDTTNQVGIRTTGAVDGGLYQTPQPFRYEVTGTNDTATATVRVVNPRLNLDDSGKVLQPDQTETFGTEGNYTIAIVVKDANGNQVLTRNIYFTIDHNAPVISNRLAPTPDKTTNKSLVPVSVSLLATDDLSGIASIEYQVNSGQWQLYTSDTAKVPLTISDNGTYTINYRATDGAGNTAPAQTINFTIEKPVVAPTGNGSRPPIGGSTTVTPTVNPNAPGGAAAGGAGGAKTTAASLTVPTVTPVPTQTPRPAVKNTPTVAATTAPPTTLASTPTISGTPLLPTGSPVITPTATVPLPTTEIITPTATIALVPVLAVPVTTLTFLAQVTSQDLEIQNTGNAPLVWNLAPGSSSTLLGFSSTTGNIAAGGSAKVTITVLGSNLTGSNENTTFSITSNGGQQTVGVIINPQPLPSATLTLLTGSSLILTNTIQVNVAIPNQNVLPDHIDLYATYKNCVSSCVAAPVKIGTYPYSGNTFTAQWNTGNVIPQDGISLSGNLCLNQDCSNPQVIDPITGLAISMTAAFVPPTTDNTLPLTTTLSITGQSERTKKVKITIMVNDVVAQQFVASPANNWSVDWNSSLVSPLSTVVIQGEACNTEDDSGVCLPIDSLTGYHTTMGGTVDATPDISIDVNRSLTSTISFVVTPTANVKSVTVTGFYAKNPTSSQETQLAGSTFAKDSNDTTFTVPVDPSIWPTQSGVSLNVNVCFNQDGTDCLPAKAYTNLFVPAGPPATIIDLSTEPKYATINTAYTNQLAAKIVDSKNNPVQGVIVEFKVPAAYQTPNGAFALFTTVFESNNGPIYYYARATTGADGIATIPASNKLVANGQEGTFQVLVTVFNQSAIDPVAISLNNTLPGAKAMTIVGNTDKQTAKIGTQFPNALQVQLEGAGPGVTVTFTSQNVGVGAIFARGSNTYRAVTDASGVATAGALYAIPSLMADPSTYPIVGVHSVRASAPGFTPVLFTLTNFVGDPSTISPVVTSTVGVYDSPVASVSYTRTIEADYPDIAAQVKDLGGNLLQNVQVTFSSVDMTQPGVFFSNNLTTNVTAATGVYQVNNPAANSGVAIAKLLRANLHAGANKVTATVVGFPAVTNNNFNFLNRAGSAASVEISVPVTGTVQAHAAYSAAVQATVYDKGHNPVLDSSGAQVIFSSPTITDPYVTSSATFTNTSNANTSYTATVSGGLGIAKVNVPVIGTCKVGSFQITATLANVATADPSNLNLGVIPGDPSSFSGSPLGSNQHTRIQSAFPTNLQTTLMDSCSNTLANQPVTFTAPSDPTQTTGNFAPAATGPISVTVNTNSVGVVTAPVFYANSKAALPSYSIVASSVNFPGVPTQSFALFNDPGVPKTITPFGVGSDATTPLSVTVGTTYTNASSGKFVQARVVDAGGNPVFPVGSPTDTKITFVGNVASTVDKNATIGAYFDSTTNSVIPDENGVITSTLPLIITNKTGAQYQILAQAVDTSVKAPFYLINIAGPAATIDVSPYTSPPSNSPGVRFQKKVNLICNNNCDYDNARAFNEFKVRVTDQFQNIITGTEVTFVAALGTSIPGGGGNPTANFGTLPTNNDSDINRRTYKTNTDSQGEITLSPGIDDSTAISSTNISAATIFPGFYAGEYTIGVSIGSASTSIYLRNLPDQTPNAVSITITTGGSSSGLGSANNPLTTTVTTAFPQFSAVVRDANRNGIGGKEVTFELTPAANISTTASGLWTNHNTDPRIVLQTDNFGNATVNNGVSGPDTPTTSSTNLEANQKAGVYTLSATVTGQNNALLSSTIYLQNIAENKVVAGASDIIFTPPSPVQVAVDQTYGSFNLHLTDQYGNPIFRYPVTFTVPVSSTTNPPTATGTFSGSTPASKQVPTDVNGDAIVQAGQLTAGIVAGDFQVTANIPVTPGSSTLISPAPFINLKNLPGAPDPANITTSVGALNQNITVGTTYSNPITITVADKHGNNITGATVSFTATPVAGSSASAVSTGFTVVNGVTILNQVTANTVTGQFTITPRANGVNAAATNRILFTNTADYPSALTILAGNNQTPNVGQLFTDTMKVQVVDQYGNQVGSTNPAGTLNQVVFTAPTTGPSAIFTNTNGVVSNVFTATVATGGEAIVDGGQSNGRVRANNLLGEYPINLSVPSLPSGRPLSQADVFTITNFADVKAVAITSPANIKKAGGEPFGALQASVVGANNTGVPNFPVTFNVDSSQLGVFASSTCGNYTVNGNVTSKTVNTDGNGLATVSNFCAGTLIGGYNITATVTINGITKTDTIRLNNTAQFEANTAGGNNQSAVVNGGVFGPLNVKVIGYNNTYIPGAQVAFNAISAAYATFNPPVDTTDNNGNAISIPTAGNRPGPYQVTANLSVPEGTGVITQTYNLTNTVRINFTSTAPTLLAGNPVGQSTVITAAVTDAGGAGVSGVNVRFSIPTADTGKGNFAGASSPGIFNGFSGAGGIVTATLQAGSTLGNYTITVLPTTDGTTSIVDPATGPDTLQATTGATLTTTSAPTPLAGGDTASISVMVKGFGGASIPNASVQFSVPAGATRGTVPGTAVPATNGTATTNLTTGNTAGTYNVVAALSASPSVTVSIPVTNKVNISVVPVSVLLLAGGTSSDGTAIQGASATLTFTTTGFNNALIDGVTVNLTSDDKDRGYFTAGSATGATSPTAGGLATANLIAGGEIGAYNVTGIGVVGAIQVSNNSATIAGTTTASLLATTMTNLIQAGGETKPISVTVTGNTVGGKSALISNAPIIYSTDVTGTNLSTLSGTPTVNTGTNGVSSLSVTTKSKVGYFKITANLQLYPAGQVGPVQQSQDITVVNTANINTTSSVSPLAGNSSVPISSTVTGFNNTPIPEAVVNFSVPSTFSTYASFGASSVATSTTASSPSAGVANANLSTQYKAGSYNVNATLNPAQFGGFYNPTDVTNIPVTNTVTLTFSSSPASPDLGAASTSTSNDGGTAALTALVRGNGNNAVSGVTVFFSTSDTSKGTTNPASKDTNGSSTSITGTLTASNGLGTYSVLAQAKSNDGSNIDVASGPVSITAKTSSNLANTLTVGDSTPLAGGAQTVVTATVTGNNGVGVQGATVAFTSSNSVRGSVSAAQMLTDANGKAAITVTTGDPGAFNITANLLNNPTPDTATLAMTSTVDLVYDAIPTPLAGGGSAGVVITAKGQGGSNIGGVDLAFTNDTSGVGGSGTGGPYTTSVGGSVAISVTSTTTGYGAWNLGITPKVGTTTVSNNGSLYNIPVTNTLLITSTTSSLVRPVVNGGTDNVSVQVYGFGSYRPNGVPVTFSTIAGTGCGASACGTVSSTPVNTTGGGTAGATITSLTGTTPSPTVAQAYTVQASINISGVQANLVPPIQAVNTLKLNKSSSPVHASDLITVTVVDNNNIGWNGFSVEYTVMNTLGSSVGVTNTNGFLCLRTCTSSAPAASQYIGAQIPSATISGTTGVAGLNFDQTVNQLSFDGITFNTAGGPNGANLEPAAATPPITITLRARIVNFPGVPVTEIVDSKTFTNLSKT